MSDQVINSNPLRGDPLSLAVMSIVNLIRPEPVDRGPWATLSVQVDEAEDEDREERVTVAHDDTSDVWAYAESVL